MPGYFDRSRFSKPNKQCLLFFTLILVFNHYASGQDARIDSLKKLLPELKDTARVNCLNRISAEYIKYLTPDVAYQQSDSGRVFALAALKESNGLGYFRGIALAFENLGELEAESGRFNKSEPFIRKAVELYDSLALSAELNWVRLTLGWVLYEQGKFDEGREVLTQASVYYKSVGNDILESRSYRMIGNSYAHQGYFMKAFEFTQRAYAMVRKHGDTFGNLFSPQRKGEMFLINEDTATAIAYYEESAAYSKAHANDRYYLRMKIDIHSLKKQYDSALICASKLKEYFQKNTNDPAILAPRLAYTELRLGEQYLNVGRANDAIHGLEKAETFFRNANSINGLLTLLDVMTRAYERLGNDEQVLRHANKMIELGERVGKRTFARDGYRFIWKVYDRKQNTSLAYDAHSKYSKLNDAIESDHHKQRIAVADLIEKENLLASELENVNRENKIKNAQLQTDLLIKKILLGGLIGFVVLGVIIYRNLSLKRRNEKLQNEQRQSALAKRATELEMQTLRAQMSPHFIFNSLNSINHFILENDNRLASDYLAKFSRLIRLILQNSRSPFVQLENEVEALQLYLELEAVRFNHHFLYKIDIAEDIDPSAVKVPPMIIQPYAENSIWHGLMQKADKGNLSIRIFQRDDDLYCEIADDGIGRRKAKEIQSKSASTHKSMGMQITAERLALLQGRSVADDYIKITDLVLADGSPGGTEVLVKIPVRYD